MPQYQVFRNDKPCSPKFDNETEALDALLRCQPTSGAVWAMKGTHYEVRVTERHSPNP